MNRNGRNEWEIGIFSVPLIRQMLSFRSVKRFSEDANIAQIPRNKYRGRK